MSYSASHVQPVFIVGCQRSGTTFLANQLGMRVGGLVTPESRFFSEALESARKGRTAGRGAGAGGRGGAGAGAGGSSGGDGRAGGDGGSSGGDGRADGQSAQFVERVRKHWRLRIWDIDAELDAVRDSLASSESLGDIVLRIVQLYGEKNDVTGRKYWIDHTPENVRYGVTLSSFFPGAKFVHIVRDGRGVANSVLRLPWGPVSARDAGQWWAQRVGYGLALESALGDRVIRVYYEDLISNPDLELQRLAAFISAEISTDRSTLNTGFRLPAYTRRQHALVSGAAEQSRVSAWKTEMEAADVVAFERASFDFLEYLGYALSDVKAPGRKSLTSRMRSLHRLATQKLRRRVYHLAKRRRAKQRQS
ncbi:MAG: sulfotransferase family protein [Spirochaetales bacterium]